MRLFRFKDGVGINVPCQVKIQGRFGGSLELSQE